MRSFPENTVSTVSSVSDSASGADSDRQPWGPGISRLRRELSTCSRRRRCWRCWRKGHLSFRAIGASPTAGPL